MRIGELSQRIGVSERSLRYYEEQGLLRPLRRPSGYREYAESDAQTVRRIRILLTAGLNTATIAEVLPCMTDTGDGLAPVCPELLIDLYRERARISGAIGELEAARTMLDTIIAAAPAESTETPACDGDAGIGREVPGSAVGGPSSGARSRATHARTRS